MSSKSFATTPTPPVSIKATLEEMKGGLVGGRFSFVIDLEQHEAVQRISVQAFLTPDNPGRFSVKRDTNFRKRVDLRKAKRLEIPVEVEDPGTYELLVRITGEIDNDNGFSDDIQRYVIVDQQNNYRIISPKQYVGEQRKERQHRFQEALKENPDSPNVRLLHENTQRLPEEITKLIRPHQVKSQLSARPVGPSKEILKYVEQKSDSAWSPEDPLSIMGNLSYLDYDGVWRPLVNVSVNLYDEDIGFDDHLGTTGTDWSGNWSFSVNNDDGWLADGRDIYYTFKLGNTRLRVKDCDSSVYRWQSSVHDDLDDGTVVDFGSETGSTSTNSMQVWNTLNLAWNGATTLGGRDPGFVDTCYPEGTGLLWSRTFEEIHIPGSGNDAADSITHEYGHAIMHYAYGGSSPSPGGPHGFGDDAQDPGLAWGEGWATGFMLALRPDGRYNWSEAPPDTGQSIENFSDAGNRDGNLNEGRVAAAINDMIDSPNDDNGGNLNRGQDGVDDDNSPNRVSLSSLLNDTLWGSWHDDFEEFWASLSGELTGATLGDANEIMYYNYMDVVPPLSCVATKVVALESRSPDDVLEGLRRFRDHALKGFNGGQNLINIYYRNSPELAVALLKNPALMRDAIEVINHFSELGFVLTENKRFRKFADTRQPLIDQFIAARIRSMLARIEEQASGDLKKDMEPLGRILASVEGLDARSLQEKLDDIKSKHPKVHREQLRQSEYNDASKKAAQSDEVTGVIKKYLPPYDER